MWRLAQLMLKTVLCNVCFAAVVLPRPSASSFNQLPPSRAKHHLALSSVSPSHPILPSLCAGAHQFHCSPLEARESGDYVASVQDAELAQQFQFPD